MLDFKGFRLAEERDKHPEGEEFREWFTGLMYKTESCFERDVLRDCQDHLWLAWKDRAKEVACGPNNEATD